MTKKAKWSIALALSISLLLLIFTIIIYPIILYNCPKRAFDAFKNRDCAEDQIIHPLIVCGKKIVPLLIDEINDKNMNKRGYAILALGHIGDSSALPALKQILYDQNEKYFIRYGAIRAIAMIDTDYAKNIARNIGVKEHQVISVFCQKLLKDEVPAFMLEKKTFWSAVLDRHE